MVQSGSLNLLEYFHFRQLKCNVRPKWVGRIRCVCVCVYNGTIKCMAEKERKKERKILSLNNDSDQWNWGRTSTAATAADKKKKKKIEKWEIFDWQHRSLFDKLEESCCCLFMSCPIIHNIFTHTLNTSNTFPSFSFVDAICLTVLFSHLIGFVHLVLLFIGCLQSHRLSKYDVQLLGSSLTPLFRHFCECVCVYLKGY